MSIMNHSVATKQLKTVDKSIVTVAIIAIAILVVAFVYAPVSQLFGAAI